MLVILMLMIRMLVCVFGDPDFMGVARVRILLVRLGMIVYVGVRM